MARPIAPAFGRQIEPEPELPTDDSVPQYAAPLTHKRAKLSANEIAVRGGIRASDSYILSEKRFARITLGVVIASAMVGFITPDLLPTGGGEPPPVVQGTVTLDDKEPDELKTGALPSTDQKADRTLVVEIAQWPAIEDVKKSARNFCRADADPDACLGAQLAAFRVLVKLPESDELAACVRKSKNGAFTDFVYAADCTAKAMPVTKVLWHRSEAHSLPINNV